MSLSFPLKDHRLSQPEMFREIFQQGLRCRVGGLFVVLLKKEIDLVRIGVVCRKKLAKRAVTRNRFRRIIREWIRLHQSDLNGYWIVVDVQKKYNRSEHQDLRDDLQKAILKLEQKYSKKNSVLA
jgi:ribonuclease P protein component